MINIEKFKMVYYQTYKNNNPNLAIDTFSFEERMYIANNAPELFEQLVNIYDENEVKKAFQMLMENIFTDEEIKTIIEKETNISEVLSLFIACSTNDIDLKIKYIEEMFHQSFDSIPIYLSIKDEQIRYEHYIKNFDEQSDFYEYDIFESFSIDNQIKFIEKIKKSDKINMFIKRLASDEIKLRYINKLTTNLHRLDILSNLKSDALKEKIIDEIKKDPWKYVLDKEDFYPGGSYKISPSDFLRDLILSIDNDEIKIKYIHLEEKNVNKLYFVESLKLDQNKIRMLNIAKNSYEIIQIIKSINDIKLKMDEFLKINAFDQIELLVMEHPKICVLPPQVIEYLSEKYKIDIESLLKMYSSFGNELINILGHPNTKEIALLNEDDYKKIEQIFGIQQSLVFDKKIVDSICDALIQRQFRFAHKEILESFATISLNIKTNPKKVEEYLKIIALAIGDDFKNILFSSNLDENNFYQQLIKDPNPEMISILHKITTRYIEIERRNYTIKRQQELDSELNFLKIYEKNYIIDKVFSTYNLDEIIKLLEGINKETLEQNQIELISNKKLLERCIKFKQDPEKINLKEDHELRKELKTFNQILTTYYLNQENDFGELVKFDADAKYILEVKPLDKQHIVEILAELDINLLKEKLFNDEKLFSDLMDILSKYRFIGWQDTFDSLLEKSDLFFDEMIISSLIGYFYKYYPVLQKNNNVSLLSILDYAELYGSIASKYHVLFDAENFAYYRKNPSPNSANIKKQERFELVPQLLRKMYERQSITVPPIDENITLGERSVRVVLGDTRNVDNITLGERTGSCARVGGGGESLFNYALLDENGINIRYHDPVSGEIVSKIVGFRNGNTVYLNELRYSLKPNVITDEDLVTATKVIANMMIEKTKDDEYPIENVVIAKAIVMESSSLESVDLSKNDFFNETKDIYTDFKQGALLIASSKNKKEIIFGRDKVTRYDILKSKAIKLTDKKEIIKRICKLKAIRGLLNNEEFGDILLPKMERYENVKELVVDEESYIAYDEEGNVIESFNIYNKQIEMINEGGFEHENQGQGLRI